MIFCDMVFQQIFFFGIKITLWTFWKYGWKGMIFCDMLFQQIFFFGIIISLWTSKSSTYDFLYTVLKKQVKFAANFMIVWE